MYEYDEECLRAFLKSQSRLFDEPVAETLEEAEAFLEDCMAAVVNSIDEVREFLEEEGLTWTVCRRRSLRKPRKCLPSRAEDI